MLTTGKMEEIGGAREMKSYQTEILTVQEIRWEGEGIIKTSKNWHYIMYKKN